MFYFGGIMALQLTPQEEKLILEHRKANEEEANARQMALVLLQVACEFETWLQENGRGFSYSTFVNEDEFGFGKYDLPLPPGEWVDFRKWFIYNKVIEIIKLARRF
jgi:hypothetical protein